MIYDEIVYMYHSFKKFKDVVDEILKELIHLEDMKDEYFSLITDFICYKSKYKELKKSYKNIDNGFKELLKNIDLQYFMFDVRIDDVCERFDLDRNEFIDFLNKFKNHSVIS